MLLPAARSFAPLLGRARFSAAAAAAPSTLADAIHAHGAASPLKLALVSPAEEISWSYEELSSRVRNLAAALAAHGYRAGDIIVNDLPNTHHNLLLQGAASHLGASVATVKDLDALEHLATATGAVRGCFAAGASSFLAASGPGELPPVVGNAGGDILGSMVPLADLLAFTGPAPGSAGDGAAPAGYFGAAAGKAPVPLLARDAVRLGREAASHLSLGPEDSVCVSVSLSHAFGIATGVGGALAGGAVTVLPSAGGIRGCGDPRQRAEVTRDALVSAQCSVLVGDSHTIKALEPLGAPRGLNLRTGLIKVGSGTEVLERTVSWAGVTFATMGTRA